LYSIIALKWLHLRYPSSPVQVWGVAATANEFTAFHYTSEGENFQPRGEKLWHFTVDDVTSLKSLIEELNTLGTVVTEYVTNLA
jgi:hypothetical protein